MKLIIEVADDIPAAVSLVSWYRGRAMLSDGNVVRISKPGLRDVDAGEAWTARIESLKVEL